MIRPNSRFDIPVFVYFHAKNPFFTSYHNLRFKLLLVEEGLQVERWDGPFCYEKSEIKETRLFPADEDGLNQLIAWLDELAAQYIPE